MREGRISHASWKVDRQLTSDFARGLCDLVPLPGGGTDIIGIFAVLSITVRCVRVCVYCWGGR